MRYVSLILIAVFLVILILMIRILQYHPVWSAVKRRETQPEPEEDEKIYWQTKAGIFMNANPSWRVYYETEVFPHGMFVRYKGTNEQKGNILICVYEERMFKAVMIALERILRHNEAPACTFCVLYGKHPSRALSAEAVSYMKEKYIHADLCLSVTHPSSAEVNRRKYLLLGIQRQKTMVLETEKALQKDVTAFYPCDLTKPALKILEKDNDARLTMQYTLARSRAMKQLEANRGLALALCDSCTKEQERIVLCGHDDESVEKMLTDCEEDAAAEGVSLYVREECEPGRRREASEWQKKITACYARCDLTEVIPCYYRDEEEAELERTAQEHLSFYPEDLRQCSVIDFFVDLLS